MFRTAQMDIQLSEGSTLQIPVIYNPKAVKANTKLVVLDDMNLIKLSKTAKDDKDGKAKAKKGCGLALNVPGIHIFGPMTHDMS